MAGRTTTATIISLVSALTALASVALSYYALRSSERAFEQSLVQNRQSLLLADRIHACAAFQTSGRRVGEQLGEMMSGVGPSARALDWDTEVAELTNLLDSSYQAGRVLDYYGPDEVSAAVGETVTSGSSAQIQWFMVRGSTPASTAQQLQNDFAANVNAVHDACKRVVGGYRDAPGATHWRQTD